MENETCISCQRPKANHSCGICQEPICKACAEYLDAATFSFLKEVPEDLTHTYYCHGCYNTTVAPALDVYNEKMERARQAYFFFDTQKRQPPILKKSKEAIQVKECVDRDETILRLAFMAVEQGFNAIINGIVTSEKVRNASYVKAMWQGSGLPAMVNAEKLEAESLRFPE